MQSMSQLSMCHIGLFATATQQDKGQWGGSCFEMWLPAFLFLTWLLHCCKLLNRQLCHQYISLLYGYAITKADTITHDYAICSFERHRSLTRTTGLLISFIWLAWYICDCSIAMLIGQSVHPLLVIVLGHIYLGQASQWDVFCTRSQPLASTSPQEEFHHSNCTMPFISWTISACWVSCTASGQ